MYTINMHIKNTCMYIVSMQAQIYTSWNSYVSVILLLPRTLKLQMHRVYVHLLPALRCMREQTNKKSVWWRAIRRVQCMWLDAGLSVHPSHIVCTCGSSSS